MAVEWMASAVKDSLALNEHVVSFPTDLPTLRAISVAWFGKSLQKLSARSELIKKVHNTPLHIMSLTYGR